MRAKARTTGQELPDFEEMTLSLLPIVQHHIRNLERKAFWTRNFTILATGGLASAAAIFMGGILSKSWLITAGNIGGVFTAATFLGTGAWYFMEKDSRLEKWEIKNIHAWQEHHGSQSPYATIA